VTTLRLETLGGTPWTEVHAAMQEAFADYAADMSYMTVGRLRHRALRNGVELAGSVGAFAGERLVGFTLVGYGTWQGQPGAFDAGTGIVQAFRGQHLARQMFAFLESELQTRGCRNFLLDVMCENEAALKAYRASGFEVLRTVDVLHLEKLQIPPSPPGLRLLPGKLAELPALGLEPLHGLAWENALEGLARVEDTLIVLRAELGGTCVGMGVADPVLRWVSFLGVPETYRGKGIGSALLAALLEALGAEGLPPRIYNLDTADAALQHFFRQRGFGDLGPQYEMGKVLPGPAMA